MGNGLLFVLSMHTMNTLMAEESRGKHDYP